jgi:hypothetical protein
MQKKPHALKLRNSAKKSARFVYRGGRGGAIIRSPHKPKTAGGQVPPRIDALKERTLKASEKAKKKARKTVTRDNKYWKKKKKRGERI